MKLTKPKQNETSKLLISTCFIGQKVRYDGKHNLLSHPKIQALQKQNRIIAICPEVAGGLTVPRAPAEIQFAYTAEDVLDGKAFIFDINGVNVTSQYLLGAKKALSLALENNVKLAMLKARSPSCSSTQVYDGTFTGNKIEGVGITTAMFRRAGIKVYDEDSIEEALSYFD